MKRFGEMSDLKPCPFCGAMPQAGVEFYKSCGTEVRLAAIVECTGCGIQKRKIFNATHPMSYVPFSDYEDAFMSVIEAWNRRASDGK